MSLDARCALRSLEDLKKVASDDSAKTTPDAIAKAIAQKTGYKTEVTK